jgi:hypothetical protein
VQKDSREAKSLRPQFDGIISYLQAIINIIPSFHHFLSILTNRQQEKPEGTAVPSGKNVSILKNQVFFSALFTAAPGIP